MQTQKLLESIAVAVFFAAAATAPAHAASLEEIIAEFCGEVAFAAVDAGEELAEAKEDLEDCPVEFDDCLSGFGVNDPVRCTSRYLDCSDDANRDAVRACETFNRRLEDAYEDALRRARREGGTGTEKNFQRWLLTQGEECLQPAVLVGDLCALVP
ncbi:MAG: hypothetical protein JSW21_02975 [Gammaproteobacteria bacterium]|nr:MAG: hypothetical protein JSW21_02975 [Gammaproteobacteria bacterium]